MIHVLLYLTFLASLLLSKYYNLGVIPQLVLLSPLLFQKDKELGFKEYKRGLLWGMPFLPLAIPYILNAECYAFVLNQLGVAFAEEIFFRGFLMQRFSNLSVSLMFSLGHVLYWFNLNSLLTFFPSLVLGWLYIRSGSILAPVIAHFSMNMFLFYLTERFPWILEILTKSLF
ncbi:CPBP family intramembrane metalloprotease [Aquifex pyrophilus]